jgi:hypothetical protein
MVEFMKIVIHEVAGALGPMGLHGQSHGTKFSHCHPYPKLIFLYLKIQNLIIFDPLKECNVSLLCRH